MIERPIIFSEDMVRAILEGRKTQTRRVVRDIRPDVSWSGGHILCSKAISVGLDVFNQQNGRMLPGDPTPCPYGLPGDRLWVRESAWYDRQEIPGLDMRCFFEGGRVKLKDGSVGQGPGHPTSYTAEDFNLNSSLVKRPSIHMPRWASRITLEIVSVRVERVQDISEADCHAEGIMPMATGGVFDGKTGVAKTHLYPNHAGAGWVSTLQDCYRSLWEKLNGPESWNENPWVWVIEFKKV